MRALLGYSVTYHTVPSIIVNGSLVMNTSTRLFSQAIYLAVLFFFSHFFGRGPHYVAYCGLGPQAVFLLQPLRARNIGPNDHVSSSSQSAYTCRLLLSCPLPKALGAADLFVSIVTFSCCRCFTYVALRVGLCGWLSPSIYAVACVSASLVFRMFHCVHGPFCSLWMDTGCFYVLVPLPCCIVCCKHLFLLRCVYLGGTAESCKVCV